MPLRHNHSPEVPAGLPKLPDVERLSERCIRIIGGNPSHFTLQGTNTYLLGTGRERILVDSGQGYANWIKDLRRVLEQENATVRDLLLTHWHPDHVGGINDLRALCPQVTVYKNAPGENQLHISDGAEFRACGVTLKAYHTPGHTTDHMVFLIVEEDTLITGDNVLGHGTAVFENLAIYTKSLQRMRTMFNGQAYPGHGPVVENGAAMISKYLEHRIKREKQVIEIMKKAGDEGRKVSELVAVMYPMLDTKLVRSAEGNVLQILQKLEGENLVVSEDMLGNGRWKWVAK
ncbi:hypothetical protein TD95_002100 [Thielaviopsis punctulata]|uniref:Metallo-beta-lactamase domain-containing protein n=1 Tax=Thielaviopsis punctulata TaxID=72032 RepID=A0A0F4Z9L1_9PEZI|nr:hypothetical protein TD95_002100 [Thielaviopsis punctulata]